MRLKRNDQNEIRMSNRLGITTPVLLDTPIVPYTWPCGTSICLGDVVEWGNRKVFTGQVFWSDYFERYEISLGTGLTLSKYESEECKFLRREMLDSFSDNIRYDNLYKNPRLDFSNKWNELTRCYMEKCGFCGHKIAEFKPYGTWHRCEECNHNNCAV